jgi:hypothetical protein
VIWLAVYLYIIGTLLFMLSCAQIFGEARADLFREHQFWGALFYLSWPITVPACFFVAVYQGSKEDA